MNDLGMAKPVGIMPNHLDLREITFTNLLLLDFNPAEMESKYRVVFNRDMFALPNKKAMEVVMHFLFTRLHPQLAYEEFRDCWPVRDKVLEQQFRKVCFSWVSRIQKEDPEARLPRIVQSLFHSPGGDRFYAFLHHFSLYVLTKVMHRDHGKTISIPTFPTKTVHNHSFTQVMSRALEAHYIVLKKRFLEFTQQAVQVEHHWKEFAMESTKEFRSLMKKKRDLEKLVMEMDGMIAPRGTTIGVKTDYQEEVEALKRTQELQKEEMNVVVVNPVSKKNEGPVKESKVRDLWAGIAEFYTVQSPQRSIVDSVLQGEANKYQIDAADFQPRAEYSIAEFVQVPDLLLRDCEREIKKKNIEDTYVSGKVNLFSLIQLWNLSLSKIKEQLSQDSLPGFDDQSPVMKSALHTHYAHLTNTTALREAIRATMPSMKESIHEMKQQCYKSFEKQDSSHHEAPVVFKLGLVPPTPPVSFAAANTPAAAERIASFNETLRMSPETVSTPDVIQAWTQSSKKNQLSGKDSEESLAKQAKIRNAEPSRLPRPKRHVQPASQGATAKPITSKSTQKRKTKPTKSYTQKSVLYPHYVTPRGQEVKKGMAKESPLILQPQTILANQIADAVAMDETTSSSLSSTTSSSRASTPIVAQALVDPVGALGQDAFQSRDLIPRTPAKQEEATFTKPISENKSGRLLETILDDSQSGVATPSPIFEENSTVPSSQADLSWSDINITPRLLKTSYVQESPPERDSLPLSVRTAFDLSGVKRTPGVAPEETVNEHESFNLSFIRATPRSVKKSLFDDSPHPPEMMTSQQQATLSQVFTQQIPQSSSLPLDIGASPKLDFWLLRQNGDNIQVTPNSKKTELFDGSPTENSNSPFEDLKFLNISGAQSRLQEDKDALEMKPPKAKPSELEIGFSLASPASKPSPVRSPLHPRRTTPEMIGVSNSSHHKLDTTELTERLNRIKHPPSNNDALELQHYESLNHSVARSPNTVVSGGTPTHHSNSVHEMVSGSSGICLTPTTTSVTKPALQHNVLSEQRDTPVAPLDVKPPTKLSTGSKNHVLSSSNDVDTSALIQRLNRIKLTQQSAFSTPHYTPLRLPEVCAEDSLPREENAAETPSDASLLASRLDQIKQAQKSQQVTPGAITGEDLSTSRTSEPALLTPLTPSSGASPSEDGIKNELVNFSFNSPRNVTSPPGSPSSYLDRNFFLQSPFKHDQAFTSPLHGNSPISMDIGVGLRLVEEPQWEAATPSLPQRLAARTGPASAGKTSSVPTTSNNGLHSVVMHTTLSTPLLVNSVQRPERITWVTGSTHTPASLVGLSGEDRQNLSPRLNLTSPFSYKGSVPSSLQDVPKSPVIGQLIDLE